MASFIKNITLFCGLVGLFFTINFMINYHRLTDPAKLEGSILIMGDSHLKTALDPSVLPESSNVCSGAESYVMTFYKLKKLIRENPQINEIFLSFSYNNFSAYQELRLNGSKAKSQFIRYYEILPFDLPEQIEINDSKFYHTYIRELALYPNYFESKYLGGFEKHEPGIERSDLTETINKHYYPEGEFVGISTYARAYLDSIAQFTKSKEILLTLVAAPLHDAYREKVPTEIQAHYSEVKSAMEEQGIPVLDFIDLPLDDVFFKDYDHLNYEGAKQFTARISDIKNPVNNRQQGQ